MILKPFFRYYGGKYRAAPKYPKPQHKTIIEPFAGAAGYAMRYPHHNIILVEKYAVIANIWKFLITATPDDILSVPTGIEHVNELDPAVPEPLRHLIGFWFNQATVYPCKKLSAGRKKSAATGRRLEGWTHATKTRLIYQLPYIRHWQVIEGDYWDAPDIEATWFIDPPYNNEKGRFYVKHDINYQHLADWSEMRKGQVMVCENEGADWMDFKPFATFPGIMGRPGSREVIWCNDETRHESNGVSRLVSQSSSQNL